MGRSSTEPLQTTLKSPSRTLGRSNTVIKTPPKQHQHHSMKLPHPHIPFTHRNDDEDAINSSTAPIRPSGNGVGGGLNRQNSVHTRYMTMLLAMDTIPRLHNILASFFCWLLLAGFLVFPGTFTSLQNLEVNPGRDGETASEFLKTVKNIPLIYIGAFCCGVGAGGMVWLWFRWRANFVWLLNRIFLPGFLNSFAGMISTLINVYSQQGGNWSTTAWITAAVTGACMFVTGVLFLLYNFWILEKVKRKHGREMEREGMGHAGEGLKEKMERKAHEPALEPGSVV